jgi:hypothetical protein
MNDWVRMGLEASGTVPYRQEKSHAGVWHTLIGGSGAGSLPSQCGSATQHVGSAIRQECEILNLWSGYIIKIDNRYRETRSLDKHFDLAVRSPFDVRAIAVMDDMILDVIHELYDPTSLPYAFDRVVPALPY